MHQILMRLRDEGSVAGEASFDSVVMKGGLVGLHHFNATLPDGNIMDIELLREKNAEVAQALPGEAFSIMIVTPVMPPSSSRPGKPKIEDMDIHSTFGSKEAANAKAEEVVQQLKTHAGAGARFDRVPNEEGVFSVILVRGTGGKVRIVQASHDTGEAHHHSFD